MPRYTIRESSSSEGRSGGGVRGLWSSYEEAAGSQAGGGQRHTLVGSSPSLGSQACSGAAWLCPQTGARSAVAQPAHGMCLPARRAHRTCCCRGAAARLHIQLRCRGGPQLLEAVQVAHIGRGWGACSGKRIRRWAIARRVDEPTCVLSPIWMHHKQSGCQGGAQLPCACLANPGRARPGRAGPSLPPPAPHARASTSHPACQSHPRRDNLTLHRCHYVLPLLPARPSAAPPQRRLGKAAGASGTELHGHATNTRRCSNKWAPRAEARPKRRAGGIECCQASLSLWQRSCNVPLMCKSQGAMCSTLHPLHPCQA